MLAIFKGIERAAQNIRCDCLAINLCGRSLILWVVFTIFIIGSRCLFCFLFCLLSEGARRRKIVLFISFEWYLYKWNQMKWFVVVSTLNALLLFLISFFPLTSCRLVSNNNFWLARYWILTVPYIHFRSIVHVVRKKNFFCVRTQSAKNLNVSMSS